MDWAGSVGASRRAVRRRIQRLRRRRASPGRAPRGGRHHRSAQSRQGAGGRPDLARGADRGRRVRAGAGSPAEAARPDAAPFSAELRIFDARRLDRDALGRPFREPLHAYRRSRRKPARRDAERRGRDAAPARLGRGAEPRPHVHRLRRHPRRSSRRPGCGCRRSRRYRAGGSVEFTTFFAAARGRARDRAGGPLSLQLPHPRSARGLQHRRGRRLRRRSWCWPSNRATIRSTRG